MTPAKRSQSEIALGILRVVVAGIPALAVLSLIAAVALVCVQTGHFPRYGDPDPALVAGPVQFLLGTVVVTAGLSVVAGALWPLLAPARAAIAASPRSPAAWVDRLFWAGWAPFVLTLASDPFGLVGWILD